MTLSPAAASHLSCLAPPVLPASGTVTQGIPGFVIIGPPHKGGMGTVWPARQLGTQRDVALKVLGIGQLSEAGRRQFVREVELSARLEHPNIARVYESGVHQGLYYYAMELIDGLPLDQFVKSRTLNTREILRLMRSICLAVQHAHVRGVIHCDLKPSNILATADAEPHVLDFGLARLAADSCTEGLNGGTPGYMSPEQARGGFDLIDTRSDVYSLGTILYRLLVGQPPTLSGEDAETDSAHEAMVRRPRQLRPELDREIEALLLRALAHDPEGRYASAGEMGRDIERYLHGEALAAMPQTMRYLLRKRLVRHRWKVVAAGAVVLLLLVGAGVSYRRIRVEAQKTQATAEFLEDVLTRMSPARSGGADPISEIVEYVNQSLQSRFADQPDVQARIRQSVGALLLSMGGFQEAEAQLEEALHLYGRTAGAESEPALAVMEQLAQVYRLRGRLAAAEQYCRRVLKSRHNRPGDGRLALKAQATLANLLVDQGRAAEAEGPLSAAWKEASGRYGANDPDTLEAAATLSIVLRDTEEDQKLPAAETLAQQTLEARKRHWPKRRLEILASQHQLASIQTVRGSLDAAIHLYKQTIQEGIEELSRPRKSGEPLPVFHPDVLIWMNDLVVALIRNKDYSEAQRICEEIDAHRSIRGRWHHENVSFLSNWGTVCAMQLLWKEAEERYTEAWRLQVRIAADGDADPFALMLLDQRARALTGQERWQEAVELYRRSCEIRRSKLPAGDPELKLAEQRLDAALDYRREAERGEPQ